MPSKAFAYLREVATSLGFNATKTVEALIFGTRTASTRALIDRTPEDNVITVKVGGG